MSSNVGRKCSQNSEVSSSHGGGDGGGDGGEHTAGQLVALHSSVTAGVPPCRLHWTQHCQMTSALPQSAGTGGTGGDGGSGGGWGEGGRKGGGIGGGSGDSEFRGGGGDGGAGQYSQVRRQSSL